MPVTVESRNQEQRENRDREQEFSKRLQFAKLYSEHHATWFREGWTNMEKQLEEQYQNQLNNPDGLIMSSPDRPENYFEKNKIYVYQPLGHEKSDKKKPDFNVYYYEDKEGKEYVTPVAVDKNGKFWSKEAMGAVLDFMGGALGHDTVTINLPNPYGGIIGKRDLNKEQILNMLSEAKERGLRIEFGPSIHEYFASGNCSEKDMKRMQQELIAVNAHHQQVSILRGARDDKIYEASHKKVTDINPVFDDNAQDYLHTILGVDAAPRAPGFAGISGDDKLKQFDKEVNLIEAELIKLDDHLQTLKNTAIQVRNDSTSANELIENPNRIHETKENKFLKLKDKKANFKDEMNVINQIQDGWNKNRGTVNNIKRGIDDKSEKIEKMQLVCRDKLEALKQEYTNAKNLINPNEANLTEQVKQEREALIAKYDQSIQKIDTRLDKLALQTPTVPGEPRKLQKIEEIRETNKDMLETHMGIGNRIAEKSNELRNKL